MADLLDQLSRAGVRVPLLVPWIPGLEPSIFEHHYAGDVLAVQPFSTANNGAYHAFADTYRARYGSEPTADAAYGYDAVRLLARALEAGGLNRAALRDAIAAQTGFVGATGTAVWDNAGGNQAEAGLVELQGGRLPMRTTRAGRP